MAYSGRPASFLSGGQFPVPVPQSLGTISVQWKSYGTQVNFVPIVLGNGAIRLEVYPERDGNRLDACRHHQRPDRAGLEDSRGQHRRGNASRTDAGVGRARANSTPIHKTRRALGWQTCPTSGRCFATMTGQDEEVELLMMVTPQLVEAIDPCEVPPGGPGTTDLEPPTTGRCISRDTSKCRVARPTTPAARRYRQRLDLRILAPPRGVADWPPTRTVQGVVGRRKKSSNPRRRCRRRRRRRRRQPRPAMPRRPRQTQPAVPTPDAPATTVDPPSTPVTAIMIDNRSVSYKPNNRAARNDAAPAQEGHNPRRESSGPLDMT